MIRGNLSATANNQFESCPFCTITRFVRIKNKVQSLRTPTTENTPPKNSVFQTEVPVVSLPLLETLSKQKTTMQPSRCKYSAH